MIVSLFLYIIKEIMMYTFIKYIFILLIIVNNTGCTQKQNKLKICRSSSCPDIKEIYYINIIVEKRNEIIINESKISYTPIKTKNYKFILNHKKIKIQYLKEREKRNLR